MNAVIYARVSTNAQDYERQLEELRCYADRMGYVVVKEFCEKNEMPFYGIHSFRHFAASALISSGLDVVTVSGALGHCNSGTTLNVYAHMFQTAQARVAQAMDGAFSFLPVEDTAS